MPGIYQERNAKTEIETIPQLRMRARWGFSDTDKPDTTLTLPQWHVRYDSSFPGSIYHVMACGGPGRVVCPGQGGPARDLRANLSAENERGKSEQVDLHSLSYARSCKRSRKSLFRR